MLKKKMSTTKKPKNQKNQGEKGVVDACMQYLRAKKYQVIRNNTGAIVVEGTRGKRLIRFGSLGSSDILACSPSGRFVAIECKSKRGKLSAYQENFLQCISKNKGIAVVARSVDDLQMAGL